MSIINKYLVVAFLGFLAAQLQALVDYQNIECKSLEENYASFDYCYLKSINRTYKFLSIKVILHKSPIHNITFKAAIYKKANGYKPFLYNVSFDACKYLKSPTSNLIYKLFHDMFKLYSNMNHSCPYSGEVMVEKLPVSHWDNLFTRYLPFPKGDYEISTIWCAYGIPRATVKLRLSLK